MKRHSWKYLAGLFDGEGCIDVQETKNKSYPGRLYVRPRVRLGMSIGALPLLTELQANFGGHMSKIRASKNENWQQSVSWEVLAAEDINWFLGNMVPHLVLKREQAKLALWWLDNMRGKQMHIDGLWVDDVRHLFVNELKAMKRDPQRLSDRAVQMMSALMR